jgi:hypothetical protein
MGQIIGASATLFVLLYSGLNSLSISLAVFTSIFTGISVLLFGSKTPDKSPYLNNKMRD